MQYHAEPCLYDKCVDRCFGQAVIPEQDQVGDGVESRCCVCLDGLGFLIDRFFADLLFKLESQSGPDIL